MSLRGARYIQIFVPCPLGWGSAPHDTIKIARIRSPDLMRDKKLLGYEGLRLDLAINPEQVAAQRIVDLTPAEIMDLRATGRVEVDFEGDARTLRAGGRESPEARLRRRSGAGRRRTARGCPRPRAPGRSAGWSSGRRRGGPGGWAAPRPPRRRPHCAPAPPMSPLSHRQGLGVTALGSRASVSQSSSSALRNAEIFRIAK